jgi:hypothetical protein
MFIDHLSYLIPTGTYSDRQISLSLKLQGAVTIFIAPSEILFIQKLQTCLWCLWCEEWCLLSCYAVWLL